MKSFLPYVITGLLTLALVIGILNPLHFSFINPDEAFATEFPDKEEELRELASIEEASSEADNEDEQLEFSESESTAAPDKVSGHSEEDNSVDKSAGASDKPSVSSGNSSDKSAGSTEKSAAKSSTSSKDSRPTEEQSGQKPAETKPVVQKITGFEPLDSSSQTYIYTIDRKPSLSSLLKEFPETLKVYLDHSTRPVSIPVSWYCLGDKYESSDLFYFQFSPSFSKQYELASYLDAAKDAPYITVSLVSAELEVTGSLSLNKALSQFYNNQKETFRFLTQTIGFNEAAACGIMANIEAESGFNPTIEGDNGHSYGICQWNTVRKTSLIKWCKANYHEYNTLIGQLNYLKFELEKNDSNYLFNGKTIYNKMMSIPNTAAGSREAGEYWCREYERPADKNAYISRGNRARNYYWANLDTRAKAVSIKDCDITISKSLYTYSGDACKPNVKVKYRGTVLKEGSDYRLGYSDNVEPGTAAVDIIGIGNYTGSATCHYTIRLKTPEITAVVNKVTGIRIDWKTVAGASGYYVLRRTPDSKWSRVKQLVRNTTSCYVDRTAEDGVEYIYSVRAYTSTNKLSDYEQDGRSITRLTRPNIYSRSNEVSAILLKWDAVQGADGYIVYRSVNNDGYIRLDKVEKGLSYLDTTATQDGVTYQYKIRAYADGQTSSASPEVVKVRMSRVRITGTSNPLSGQMKVEWTKKTAARGYQVQYCTDSSFPKAQRVTRTIIGADNLSITIRDLQPKTRYYIRARAYIRTNSGVYFSEWSDVQQQVVR